MKLVLVAVLLSLGPISMEASASAAAGGEEVAKQSQQAAWDGAVLSLLCSLLDAKTLCRARAVCKAWRAVASDPQVRRAAFIHNWQLLGCHGMPRQLLFFETAAVTSFVREHAVQRSDSLQMLAVRHGVTVPCLKRVNNLMSDFALHSRTQLFIPVAGQQELSGQLVCFKFCPIIKRDFAVVLAAQLHGHHNQQQQQGDVLEKQHQQQEGGGSHSPNSSAQKVDILQARLCQMLGRSLYIDESTASFYLEDAGGDMKAAMEAFAQDVAWEGTTAGPIRTVLVQRWISGELGL